MLTFHLDTWGREPMIRLYHQFKNKDFLYLIPLIALSLRVRLQYFYYLQSSGKGFPDAADSQWYLAYARSLIADFKIGLHMNDILYFGYNLLLALLLAVFKDPATIVLIQAVTASLSIILVFKIARMLFNRTTAVIASLIYAYSWDITLWSTYILTDSFFISLLLLCVYFLLKSLESDNKIYTVLFVATSAYLLLFRPTGILSLAFITIYLIIRMDKRKALAFARKHKYGIGTALTAAAAVLVCLLLAGKLNPLAASLQFNAKMVLYNVYAKGWIYDHATPHDVFYRPDYTIDIGNSLILSFLIHNWDHVLAIYARRIVAFLGRWVWQTDLGSLSGIKKFASDILPFVLFLIGSIAAIVNGLFKKASIIWLIILAVFVFCIMLFIDGMYRYKAPSIPFIGIAAAYGAYSIFNAIVGFVRKGAGKLPWKNKIRDWRAGA